MPRYRHRPDSSQETTALLSLLQKRIGRRRAAGHLQALQRWLISLTLVFLACGAASTAHAELVLSAYSGKAMTLDGGLTLDQPGGLHLSFSDVSWSDASFTLPPYYGLRAAFYLPRALNWGFAVDFAHAKMILQTNRAVPVTGTRAGTPVHGVERIQDSIQGFELSHGHNLLTLNLMYRWFPQGQRNASWLGRTQPYVGAGVGLAIPHVEAQIEGVRTYAYQVTGPAAQGLVGLNFDLFSFTSVFGEYRIAYAHVTAELQGGGTITVQPITHHFVFGVSVRF